jgi:hypothetical protein
MNTVFTSHFGDTRNGRRNHWNARPCLLAMIRAAGIRAALDTVDPNDIHTTVIDETPRGIEVLSYRSEDGFQSRVDEVTQPVG